MNDSEKPVNLGEKINLDQFLKIEKLKEEIEKLKNQNTKLQSRLDRSKESRPQVDTSMLEQLRKENNKLQEENQDLKQKIGKLKDQFSTQPEIGIEVDPEIQTTIEKQKQIIKDLEDELIEQDSKYDQLVMKLKKQIRSLQNDLKKLEDDKKHASVKKFGHFNARTQYQGKQESSDILLMDKMKDLVKSWPGGIKLRNMAMSLGISVSVAKEYLQVLEQEQLVIIEFNGKEDTNPKIFPK